MIFSGHPTFWRERFGGFCWEKSTNEHGLACRRMHEKAETSRVIENGGHEELGWAY